MSLQRARSWLEDTKSLEKLVLVYLAAIDTRQINLYGFAEVIESNGRFHVGTCSMCDDHL
jgi:hypothetical protein